VGPSLIERLRGLVGRLLLRPGSRALGHAGEAAAARYLEGEGYVVVARNFRARGGEADLVVTRGGFVHAVEVKSRSGRSFGTPAEAVTPKKARRVIRAGRTYCRAKGISLAKLRCDVIAVEATPDGKLTVRHYPNALNEPAPRRR